MQAVNDIVWFLCLITPSVNADLLYDMWEQHAVLADYEKPDFSTLQQWLIEIRRGYGKAN